MSSLLLLTRFRLRARTALHTSLTLSTYSEFGLIVAVSAVGSGFIDQSWVATIGVAVALSFGLASIASTGRYRFYARWQSVLGRLERVPTIEEDGVIDLSGARVLVFGMGRVGIGAYDELAIDSPGEVAGIERLTETVEKHVHEGRAVVKGDALDRDFWERVRLHPEIRLVVAAMSTHSANLECARRVREFLPGSRIAAIATFPDQVAELEAVGVDVARNLYEEAGQALAIDAIRTLREDGASGPNRDRSE